MRIKIRTFHIKTNKVNIVSVLYIHKITKSPLWKYIQYILEILREKEGDLTQSYDKTPYTNRKFENQRTTHKRRQNFD